MQSIEFLTKDGVGITCNRQGYLTGLSLNRENTSVRLSDFSGVVVEGFVLKI